MIKKVKNGLAEKHVREFLNNMMELGFDSSEIMSIISEIMKTEGDET